MRLIDGDVVNTMSLVGTPCVLLGAWATLKRDWYEVTVYMVHVCHHDAANRVYLRSWLSIECSTTLFVVANFWSQNEIHYLPASSLRILRQTCMAVEV